jgi:hypothetical protein
VDELERHFAVQRFECRDHRVEKPGDIPECRRVCEEPKWGHFMTPMERSPLPDDPKGITIHCSQLPFARIILQSQLAPQSGFEDGTYEKGGIYDPRRLYMSCSLILYG